MGKPTIGLGHLIKSQKELDSYCDNEPINKDELWKLFLEMDAPKYDKIIKDAITIKLTPCQYDALFSFVFNTGTAGNKLKNLINSGDFTSKQIKDAMMEWDTPSIVIERRKDEVKLITECEYTFRGNSITK